MSAERAYLVAHLKIADITFALNRIDAEVTGMYRDYEALKTERDKLAELLIWVATSLEAGVLPSTVVERVREVVDCYANA